MLTFLNTARYAQLSLLIPSTRQTERRSALIDRLGRLFLVTSRTRELLDRFDTMQRATAEGLTAETTELHTAAKALVALLESRISSAVPYLQNQKGLSLLTAAWILQKRVSIEDGGEALFPFFKGSASLSISECEKKLEHALYAVQRELDGLLKGSYRLPRPASNA